MHRRIDASSPARQSERRPERQRSHAILDGFVDCFAARASYADGGSGDSSI